MITVCTQGNQKSLLVVVAVVKRFGEYISHIFMQKDHATMEKDMLEGFGTDWRAGLGGCVEWDMDVDTVYRQGTIPQDVLH